MAYSVQEKGKEAKIMKKRISSLKWVAAAFMVVMLLAPVSAAHGGGRWRGADPELVVNGHKVNIVVAVPPGQWCYIDGPIEFQVQVPDLDNAFFIAESTLEHVPGNSLTSEPDQTKCGAYTHTVLKEQDRNENAIFVKAYASVDRRSIPVDITISVDGVEQLVCSGRSNKTIKCAPVALD